MTDKSREQVWEYGQDFLRSLDSMHRLRQDKLCEVVPGSDSNVRRIVDGKELLNFCSNDYLDLSHHPAVKEAAIKATEKFGTGSMASRLICGTLTIHLELEEALARLKRTEAALVFSSGYLACVGAVQVLSTRADGTRLPVVFDRMVHASLIDGATRDRRNWRSFPHNDVSSLEILLKKLACKEWPSALVITEGVFSMDGDLSPLQAMSELCAEHKALLLVDDAHGTGVLGENGAGSVELAGISDAPHVVQVGTLSKALGSQGGFVAGPKILRDLLVNTARTFIFDTGLNPAATAASIAALKIMADEPERRQKLHENVQTFRSMLKRVGCQNEISSPIVPVILGDEERALDGAAQLRKEGFLVSAIRPPTVPQGTSRLRVTLSSAHDNEDVKRLSRSISMLEASDPTRR